VQKKGDNIMTIRKAAVLCLIALATFAFSACGMAEPMGKPMEKPAASASTNQGATAGAQYHKISPQEAKDRMEKNAKVIILDVRTKGEYTEGHIKNAINVPNESITTQQPQELPDKNAEILVYCHSGNRSRQASEKLVKMGYTKIYDFGGVNTWTYGLVK
jgi:phage shock protein E